METIIRNVSETNDLVSWMKCELVTHECTLDSASFTTEFLNVPSLIPVIMSAATAQIQLPVHWLLNGLEFTSNYALFQ